METQCHSPPEGTRGRQTQPHGWGARGHKGGTAFVPPRHQHRVEGGDSPFTVSHVTAGLAESWALFPCRAARCSQQGNIYVSRGLSSARDAAPLPRTAIKQRRALECFWESAGIGLHMNSPARFRLQPRGYF